MELTETERPACLLEHYVQEGIDNGIALIVDAAGPVAAVIYGQDEIGSIEIGLTSFDSNDEASDILTALRFLPPTERVLTRMAAVCACRSARRKAIEWQRGQHREAA